MQARTWIAVVAACLATTVPARNRRRPRASKGVEERSDAMGAR